MADSKGTRSRKRRKPDPFSVVRGKVVERIEISTLLKPVQSGSFSKTRLTWDLISIRSSASHLITLTSKPEITDRSNAGHLWKANSKP